MEDRKLPDFAALIGLLGHNAFLNPTNIPCLNTKLEGIKTETAPGARINRIKPDMNYDAAHHAEFAMKIYRDEMVIALEDLDFGNRSVTNDMEWVIEQLHERVPDFDSYRLIYRDSMGIWDAVVILADGGHAIVSLGMEKSERVAVAKAVSMSPIPTRQI
jgi:hypothetical protein